MRLRSILAAVAFVCGATFAVTFAACGGTSVAPGDGGSDGTVSDAPTDGVAKSDGGFPCLLPCLLAAAAIAASPFAMACGSHAGLRVAQASRAGNGGP